MNRFYLLAVVAVFWLSACSNIYVEQKSPKDSEATDNLPAITVIAVSRSTILEANASPYVPYNVDPSFSQVLRAGEVPKAGSLPEPVYEEIEPSRPTRVSLPSEEIVGPYLIGVGDKLRVSRIVEIQSTLNLLGSSTEDSIAPNRENATFIVQGNGTVSDVEFGTVPVLGLTLKEAESTIFEAFLDEKKNPEFGLEIEEENSQFVSVSGRVRRPGLVTITQQPLTLKTAIQSVGGISPTKSEYVNIVLVRDGVNYQVPYDVLFSGGVREPVILKDNDAIIIDEVYSQSEAQLGFNADIRLRNQKRAEEAEESATRRANFIAKQSLGALPRDYVYLAGAVTGPGRFPLPYEQKAKLADALYGAARGPAVSRGDVSQLYILRNDPKRNKINAYHIDATNAAALVMTTELELRPNDIIFLATQPVTQWNGVIGQLLPTFTLARSIKTSGF